MDFEGLNLLCQGLLLLEPVDGHFPPGNVVRLGSRLANRTYILNLGRYFLVGAAKDSKDRLG